MSTSTIKILFIGFHVAHTGFTRVMHSIIAHLDPSFEIHYAAMGLNHCEPTYPWGDNVTIHLYNKEGDFDPLRINMAKNFIAEKNPDIVFLLNDLWLFKPYYKALKESLGDTKLIYYAPIDGKLADYNNLDCFELVDEVVAYTQFGQQEIDNAFSLLQAQGQMTKTPSTSIISHGVDTKRFRPLGGKVGTKEWQAGKRAARHKLWGEAMEEAFIVLNANRPQSRKQIELTIEGFAKFAKNKPDNVKLCLHHAVMPFGEEKQIMDWVKKWEIEDRLLFSKATTANEYISDERLNLIYNACDVGVNTSVGEGWGLIAFEHAATGAAQIVPDHSACKALWQNAALLLPTVESFQPPKHQMMFERVAAKDLTTYLEQLYNDRNLLTAWSLRAYENTVSPEYSWKTIGKKWSNLFLEKQSADNKITIQM